MIQEIFIVDAQIVDANGTFNQISGYPKAFKSTVYGNDIEKTKQRAIGDWHDVMSGFSKRDDRQIQIAYVVRLSNGSFVANGQFGKLPDIPEPEQTTEE